MDLTREFQRAVAFALLPLLLIASTLCVCGSAAAAELPAESDHSCCHDKGDGSGRNQHSGQEHRADCNHCGQSTITPQESASIPAPHVAPLPWMLASAPPVEFYSPTCSFIPPAERYDAEPYPARPLFCLKCALLI